MSLTERRVKADRQTMLVENDYRCHGCGRQFIDRPDMLILDEVQERWDNGAHHAGNQQLLCKDRCNPKKTRVQQQRRKAQGRLYRHRSFPRFALSIVGVALVVYAGARLAGWSLQAHAWPLAGVGLVVVCLFDLHVYRDRRRAMVHRLSAGLAPDVHMPRDKRVVKVHGWTGWWWPRPTAVTVSFAPAFVDTDDPKVRAGIVATTCRIAGNQLADADWSQAHRGRVRLDQGEARREDLTADPLPSATLEDEKTPSSLDRFEAALAALTHGEVDVTRLGPDEVMIGYPPAYRADRDEDRLALVSVVSSMLGDRWRGEWDTLDGTVTLTRRPAMPSTVARAAEIHPDPARLPLGVDEHGDVAAWRLDVAPHALIIGRTGMGKTVTLRALITAALERRFDVRLVDPKQLELYGYRHRVAACAVEVDDMITLVAATHDDMRARYTGLREHPELEQSLTPILLVMDEAREWIDLANAKHRDGKRTTGEHPVVEQWRSIARLGRRARVHLLVGIQRPDAKVFGGEARDNYGLRAAVGPVSMEAARMIFGDGSVGRDLPADVPGRMTVDLGSGPVEVQGFFEEAP